NDTANIAHHHELQRRLAAGRAASSIKFFGQPTPSRTDPTKMELISVENWKTNLIAVCWSQEIMSDEGMLGVAVLTLDVIPLKQWIDHSNALKARGHSVTFDGLVTFLRNEFEPLSSAWDATAHLIELRFNDQKVDADLGQHNALVKELLQRFDEEGKVPDVVKLNIYRCTLPYNLQKEAFNNSVTSLATAMETTARFWRTTRLLAARQKQQPTVSADVEYMDVDRMTYDENLPCSLEEFDVRMQKGLYDELSESESDQGNA
ncbi:hypothetical protein IWW48_006366, partial [Coemansia sp. RSA 1200]